MPFLDIRLAAPCLPENVAKIARRMTRLAAEVLGQRLEETVAVVQCVAPGHWTVGGESLQASGSAGFFVEASVPEGANTAAERAAFVAAAFCAAEAVLGRLDKASYVIVREVAAQDWGSRGLACAADDRAIGLRQSGKVSLRSTA